MKYNYTAIFMQDENKEKFYCRVPDLPGCITTGKDLNDAIKMITDAASGWLVVAEDEGNEIPESTPQGELHMSAGEICSIICVDTIEYRTATDTRAVRKNVSLPAWIQNLPTSTE